MKRVRTRNNRINIFRADCLEVMKKMKDNCVDSIITDPPYALGAHKNSKRGFMGKEWDQLPSIEYWQEMLRIAKPGAILLSFGGPRTFHRLACNIEDAGWEVRDCLCYLFGSGFPKSLDISKSLDKMKGLKREVVGPGRKHGGRAFGKGCGDPVYSGGIFGGGIPPITAPASNEAELWKGWGTALKPAYEPIIWAKKPFIMVPLDDLAQAELNIGGLLCLLLSNVKHVKSFLQLNQSEYVGGSISAQIIAVVHHGLLSGDLYVQTAMCKSPEMAKIVLSIVESWSVILGAVYESQNMFTTSTALNLTTALGIFNCLISGIMRDAITLDGANQLGRLLRVPIVDASSKGKNATKVSVTSAHELVLLLTKLNTVNNAGVNFMPVVRAASSALQNAITNLEKNLSPSYEPIILAMKPLDGTFAQNALKWGVAGLNIDACRVPTTGKDAKRHLAEWNRFQSKAASAGTVIDHGYKAIALSQYAKAGRWPANLILDGEAAALLDQQSGITKSGAMKREVGAYDGTSHTKMLRGKSGPSNQHGDSGGASRFFYCAKASPKERGGFNRHPTLKPLALLRYLCLLTKTPTGGVVLDPFMGSGTTGVACLETGRKFVGIEKEKDYFEIAKRRIQEKIKNK